MYKLLLKANRVVHTEKCIYWYRVGRKDTLSQVWTEKRVLDEMEAKNEKLALLGMLGYDLTWHRYIYKTRLKRAIEKMEEANLQDTETYKTAQVNLRFWSNKGRGLSYLLLGLVRKDNYAYYCTRT